MSFTYVKPDCTWYTKEEIEKAVSYNGGILNTYGFGYTCPERPSNLIIEGYQVQLVNRQGMGNHGSYIAVATTFKTFKSQLKETLKGLRTLAEQTAKDLKAWSNAHTVECGPRLIPITFSPLWKGGLFIGEDELFRYYCHPHGNFARLGDDRVRIWAKLK